MSENLIELRNMLTSFRVSELQMILGYAGRNKSGRKTELQQRAIDLLRTRSDLIHRKIRDIYKSIQQSGSAYTTPPPDGLGSPELTNQLNMPQQRTTATVHPYSVDSSRQITTRAMYSQNLFAPNQLYNPGMSPVAPTLSNYPVHPDVQFKRLPFFDIIGELLRPSSLVPQSNNRMQNVTFHFHLTPQQATDIATSRDIRSGSRCEYIKQVQMRFCLLETSCEQEDFFPPNVVVKVNNKLCPLPNPIPTNKPGVEPKRPPRPVNITPMVKLSPTVANTIHISWTADFGRCYAVSICLVHKRNSGDLLQRLKSRGAKHADYTRGLIKEKLKEDADCEIATTSLRVSLLCPLGKMRMQTPCRAFTCQHLQCFDASLFLQMNERKPTWNCPVCDKPSLYDNLVIDGYFQEVLESPVLASDTNEIQLHQDGSWSIQTVEKKVSAIASEKLDDSVQIITDDVELVTSSTTLKGECLPPPPEVKQTVVDLTISDSDDDDEPLAKRTRTIKSQPKSVTAAHLFGENTSISSSSAQSTISTTPGASSVSSSGCPASPNVITLDTPSPPRSPPTPANPAPPQPSSCMLDANGAAASQPASIFASNSIPYLDLDYDTLNYY